MQTISVQTTQNVTIQYPVASVGDRILAYLLDSIVLIGYTFAIILAFVNMELDVWWLYVIFLAIPWFFYHLTFEILMNGQSPGKRVMNIKVVRLSGTQPTIGDYMLRWIFSLVDLWALSGAIAVVVIASNGRGQRIGDIVAGTSVVKLVSDREATAEKVFITPENTYIPIFPQAAQLQSRDIELIQRALEANSNHGNGQPVILASEKVKATLGIRSELHPVQFLYTIVKDFNHLTSQ